MSFQSGSAALVFDSLLTVHPSLVDNQTGPGEFDQSNLNGHQTRENFDSLPYFLNLIIFEMTTSKDEIENMWD